MTDKERFGGKRPYNGSPCETFHCSKCVIEEQEREFMREFKRVLEAKELYTLYKGMSLSMQKAVKDIMIVANGGEIDD